MVVVVDVVTTVELLVVGMDVEVVVVGAIGTQSFRLDVSRATATGRVPPS